MLEYTIPLIIRGKVIEDDLVRFEARRGELVFHTPDVNKYFDRITLRNPTDIADLYSITLDDIIDYLAQLGPRLSPDHNEHMAKALDISVETSGLSRHMLRSQYIAMGANLKGSLVREVVEHNIGSRYLEGWETRKLSGLSVAVRAFGGRFVHLNAGNGPAVALFALINGSVLRCDNIVKSPSNDPYTAVAIARSMIDMAPDHPVTKHMTVAYWKGGDKEFERQLYGTGRIDKIVAWGGQSSMKSIRNYLGPGLDLVALDPKVSVSIIGPEAFDSAETQADAAERLARDFGYFNQEGCVNSRVAYVICGTDDEGVKMLNTFGKAVNAAMLALPKHMSTPHPAFDANLKDEIDGIRYSESYRVFGCRDDRGGVIVSQSNDPVDFRDRLACRVINLVPVDHAAQAIDAITVHTQTVGIYPEMLKNEIREQCLLHGAQRLTDLGCALFAGMAYPHDGIEILRRMARWGVMETFSREVMEEGAGLILAKEELTV